jgi:hypothetical protein
VDLTLACFSSGAHTNSREFFTPVFPRTALCASDALAVGMPIQVVPL